MSVQRIIYFVLIALLFAIFCSGCDDYNIVEPRFFEDVQNNDQSQLEYDNYLFRVSLPRACVIGLYLLGSAGEVIEVVYEGYLPAGVHYFEFDWRDENGHKYPDGVYCSLLLGDGFKCMKCVEYDDPEDYLP